MEVTTTSETSVNFYRTTRRFNSEGSHLRMFTYLTVMMMFWVLAPCRLVDRCQRFRDTYYLHLQGQRIPDLSQQFIVRRCVFLCLQVKITTRFGSSLCFHYQVEIYNLNFWVHWIKLITVSGLFPVNPSDLHLVTETKPTSGTSCVFKLIDGGNCARICFSLFAHLHQIPLD
jgi:hypothetical protein